MSERKRGYEEMVNTAKKARAALIKAPSNKTRRVVEALLCFRPVTKMSTVDWMNKLSNEGILKTVAMRLGMDERELRKTYMNSSVHGHMTTETKNDVSLESHYWRYWSEMYSWSTEEIGRLAMTGSIEHEKFTTKQNKSATCTSDVEEPSSNEPDKDETSESPSEPERISIRRGTMPLACFGPGTLDITRGSLFQIKYNTELHTAEVFLPGPMCIPEINSVDGDIIVTMGKPGFGTTVKILSPRGYLPIRVTHETIQVAPDRNPVFLKILVNYA